MIIHHGSEDSLDTDVYREVTDPKDTEYLNSTLDLFIFIVYIYSF